MVENLIQQYVKPTYFLDFKNPLIEEKVKSIINGETDIRKQIIHVFYFVRDQIEMKNLQTLIQRKYLRSSFILESGYGFCVSKAILLASLIRALNVPSRLHFVDIKNYRIKEELKNFLKTDVIVWHSYAEIYIDNLWIKVTPALNKEDCIKRQLPPIEFDGYHDALFAQKDDLGNKYIEYICDHGIYDDVPYNKIVTAWAMTYGPNIIPCGIYNECTTPNNSV